MNSGFVVEVMFSRNGPYRYQWGLDNLYENHCGVCVWSSLPSDSTIWLQAECVALLSLG